MKYTIAGILLVATALLIWVGKTGSGTDVAIMAVAIVSVTFFASLGNLWNIIYRKKQAERKVDLSNATVIRMSGAAEPGDSPAKPEQP